MLLLQVLSGCEWAQLPVFLHRKWRQPSRCCRIERTICRMLCPVPDAKEELFLPITHELKIDTPDTQCLTPLCSFPSVFPILGQGTSSSKLLSQRETPNICSGPLPFLGSQPTSPVQAADAGSILKYILHIFAAFSRLTGPALPMASSPPLG